MLMRVPFIPYKLGQIYLRQMNFGCDIKCINHQRAVQLGSKHKTISYSLLSFHSLKAREPVFTSLKVLSLTFKGCFMTFESKKY